MSINPMRNAHAAPRCRGLIRISRKRLRAATIDQPLWRDRALGRPPLGARPRSVVGSFDNATPTLTVTRMVGWGLRQSGKFQEAEFFQWGDWLIRAHIESRVQKRARHPCITLRRHHAQYRR